MSSRRARADDDRLAEVAPVFAALGDGTRLRLVARLCREGPASIAVLAADAHVTRQAVTKHLEALEAAGLARGVRAGRERIFELRPRRLAEVQRCLERISGQWDRALERLRDFVES